MIGSSSDDFLEKPKINLFLNWKMITIFVTFTYKTCNSSITRPEILFFFLNQILKTRDIPYKLIYKCRSL